jgi:hypothetical protein
VRVLCVLCDYFWSAMKKIKLFSFITFISIVAFSQNAIGQKKEIPKTKGVHSIIICFGNKTKGNITIQKLMSDSLHFTDGFADSIEFIDGFQLVLRCNNQVLHSYENVSGNKISQAMISAVKGIHSGCEIIFEAITIKALFPDENGIYRTLTSSGKLYLVLK